VLPEKELVRSNGQLKLFVTVIVAIIGLVVMVQTLALSMVERASVVYAQSPVITPTLTTNEQIQAYIDSHIIQENTMPAVLPAEEAVLDPQGDVANDAAWSGGASAVGDPGEIVAYALTLSNIGTLDDEYVVTAVSTWDLIVSPITLTINSGDSSPVSVSVTVPLTAVDGEFDTAVITATSQADPSVTITTYLTTTVGSNVLYLPLVFKPVLPPTLSATRPNSANDWQMNWTTSDAAAITGFELQQSQDATFGTGVTTFNLAASATSQLINTIQPSANNVYYFRLRTLSGAQSSPWSATVKVIGAYSDSFTNNQTGWSGPTLKDGLRRLTYIEKTDAWYENNDWLIIRVEDSWDWAIASPLKPAPTPPYVIEFRSMPANLGNLVSHGVVFGADWGGAPCPDWSTLQGVYAHQNCFNHFYNTNLIWSSNNDLTLLWERIDSLVYCPQCGGSPLKRLGHVPAAIPFSGNVNASGWNDYRIEVRASDIKFFMNGQLRYTYNDTRWINEPYFGVFASTDEYSNSTWRYEYFKITPLDN
jgi:hypothetical protein